MLNELQVRWLAMLRSGHFKQGTGALKTRLKANEKITYCCLGVACEALGCEWIEHPTGNGKGAFHSRPIINVNDSAKWSRALGYGMLSRDMLDAFRIDYSIQERLVEMNDFGGKSFTEIADLLEDLWT